MKPGHTVMPLEATLLRGHLVLACSSGSVYTRLCGSGDARNRPTHARKYSSASLPPWPDPPSRETLSDESYGAWLLCILLERPRQL